MNPEPMNTDLDRYDRTPDANWRMSVFIGSGFAALPRPGMTP